MEKVNEEMSLVKIDNSFLGKMRRFWNKIFSKKLFKYGENSNVEESTQTNENVEEIGEEKKKNKLFNYDDPQNYFQFDATNEMTKEGNSMDNNDYNQDDVGKYFDGGEDSKNISEDSNANYMDEDFKGSNYEEKEELEQKLINYYESIKGQLVNSRSDEK